MYICICLDQAIPFVVTFLNYFSYTRQFISNGYAVIFLHRSSSLLPYHRILTPPKLDSLDVNPNGDVIMTTGETVKPVLSKYKLVTIIGVI